MRWRKTALGAVLGLLGFAAVAGVSVSTANAASKTKFWNITGDTVVKFELAPAGTTKWGRDLCKDDPDDSVDDDERLIVKGVPSATYDARLTYKDGGICYAKNIKVVEGKIFSIEKNQLVNCTKPR